MKIIATEKELNYFNKQVLTHFLEQKKDGFGKLLLTKEELNYFVFGYFLKKWKMWYWEYFDLDFDKKSKKIKYFMIKH